jgi:NTP pyrophosphatase (non-canonical NTP hydrolase)
MTLEIKEIQNKLAKFAEERDWDQFHSPKNLAMALASEVGELNELFQWLTEEQSSIKDDSAKTDEIRQEIADIFIYLLRLADKLDIDIEEAVREKIEINAKKYPIDLSKGNAIKYNRR